jgi:hypothetical protein
MFGPPPVPGSAQASPSTERTTASAPFTDGVVPAVALIVVTLVVGIALQLLRRGRRIALPEPAQAVRTGPELPTAARPASRPTAQSAGSSATFKQSPPSTAPASGRRLDDGYGRSYGQMPDGPVPDGPAPATPTDPTTARVETSLRAGRDTLNVSLIGSRAAAGAVLLGRGDAGPPRTGGAVVRLGGAGPDALWVDLAASPDVVTITGAAGGVRRQSEEIARQLARAGVRTVAVGDVAGVTDLVSRTVSSLRELTNGSDPAQLLVVFVDTLAAGDVTVLRKLVSRRRPRVVAVAAGSGPRSRWSIDVT